MKKVFIKYRTRKKGGQNYWKNYGLLPDKKKAMEAERSLSQIDLSNIEPATPTELEERKIRLKKIALRRMEQYRQNQWKNYGMGKYYHGTDKVKGFFIEKEGLKPLKEVKKDNPFAQSTSDFSNEDYIYVFPKFEQAKIYADIAAERAGTMPIVFEAEIEDKKLEKDLSPGMQWMQGKKLKGNVPPGKLKRIDIDYEEYKKNKK